MAKKKAPALTPEEKLRQTFVPIEEQPYPIPDNWCWVYALSVLNIEYGKGLPTKQLTERGYPVFGANGQIGFYHSYMFDDAKALMSCRGVYSGTMNLSLPKSFVTNNSLVIDCKDSAISTKFIYFLFEGLDKESLVSGTAQPQVTVQAFASYPVPLPPFAEQYRIVAHIENLFAKLDEAKEKLQAVVDSFETRKAAILHRAFTGELTVKWREAHGVGMETWEYYKIGDFAEVKGGKRLPKGHTLVTEKTAHPYLRIADFGESSIDISDLHYIKDDTFEQISRYIIRKEDVYLSIVGSIGKAGVIPDELDGANLTENAARIISKRTIPMFLCRFLSTPAAQNDIRNRIRSATLGKLSLLNIKEIKVPLPSNEEQAEIVYMIDSLFEKERQTQSAVQSALAQINFIKKSILARAFRGELGTNDPGEESAKEILREVVM